MIIDADGNVIRRVRIDGELKEFVVPDEMGCAYNIYIDERLDDAHALIEYQHALGHIQRNDWSKSDVQEIEATAHK